MPMALLPNSRLKSFILTSPSYEEHPCLNSNPKLCLDFTANPEHSLLPYKDIVKQYRDCKIENFVFVYHIALGTGETTR